MVWSSSQIVVMKSVFSTKKHGIYDCQDTTAHNIHHLQFLHAYRTALHTVESIQILGVDDGGAKAPSEQGDC